MDNQLLDRKLSIILATVDVIDEFGLQGLSTREVAKRVGISEPAIFRHFKSKGGLLLAVLEHFSQYDSDIILSIQVKKIDPIKAITNFIDTYAAYYENYPAITAITQSYDIVRCDPYLSEKIQSIFFTRINFITEMISQAQKNGQINPDINSQNLATVIMGLQRESCLNWRMQGYNFSLRKQILSTLEMVLEAFKV
ncbi:TetR/AcrR family transcriptional regulator [Pseudobacteroides cellulosolvens]|uniref:Transcriptional regulator, TetR family n=1 Tax=Pseudobacteroides cellulosolvens ATCC 35603 = DSM 2933 TaxID=398512 RepID=A0A0L6JJN9_9FIRM|nr:TetR/AcrR family transcriptional regulator [Pseudobacteroides cellulosolvens]KNY25955.1 transcriptional regulator, TetR family [Pseudobacteroides cellulosolvens ATCC 35603 = DSM 2933]